MRAVIQRVSRASVRVDLKTVGEIGSGLLVLLGVASGDTQQAADYIVEKVATMRIFADPAGRMNLSIGDIRGGVLVVSQFTLYGDMRSGRRPSFIDAARPDTAIPLYEYVLQAFRARGLHTEAGIFGAMMEVELVNDGPVTILLDSQKAF
jgi:D-aminoacyl-tRNA deacylase